MSFEIAYRFQRGGVPSTPGSSNGPRSWATPLDDAHRDGAPRAKYLGAFGFTRARPDQLAAAPAEQAVGCGPGREVRPPIGSPRLVIEGPPAAPDGRSANVRTVREPTGAEARLVTLVPLTP